MPRRFEFGFAPAYRVAGLLAGVTPRTAYVEVGEGAGGELRVHYGPWRLRTPVANVAGTEVTGGFAFVKTAGPPHLSFADRGVSFATNGERGLCVRFHEPVSAIDWVGRIRHPGATLTVADVDGLASALARG